MNNKRTFEASTTSAPKRNKIFDFNDQEDGEESSNRKGKDFVIPLITKNIYKLLDGKDMDGPQNNGNANSTTGQTGSSSVASTSAALKTSSPDIKYGLNIKDKAFAPKIPSSNAGPDPIKKAALSVEEQAMTSLLQGNIPILAQNAIPGMNELKSDKEKYLHDISHRPDETSLEDYNRIPIEDFGKALLKGMGWKEGTAVGKNPNGLVAPIVLAPRAALLGLGATAAPDLVEKKSKPLLPGDKIPSEKIIPKRKEYSPPPPRKQASIASGMHVIITGGSKKGLKGKVVELSEKSDGTVVKIKLDNSNGDIVRVWDDQVREHIAEPSTYWLRPHIRVRIISKSFKDGRFYNEKCIVQDVTTRGQCILKTAQGIILDNVLQRYLETVIPSVGKRVVVVYHSDRSLIGQVGKLLEYHEKTQSGLVQMETTFDMETISFDDMAEFIDRL